MTSIEKNKVVKMHYKGTLSDGEVFDSSEGREPLEFIFGSGMIIPGLEEGLEGMNVGDNKKIEVSADKAYGPVMPEARQEVPKEQLPQDQELKVGMQLLAQGPQGAIPVKIAEVKDTTIVVDFNHPLAGKDLIFEVTIEEVRDATPEELSHGHVHGPQGHEHDDHEADGAAAQSSAPTGESADLESTLEGSEESTNSEVKKE